MIRHAVSTALATLVAGVLVVGSLAAATDVTFVMKNGERISGTFSYDHTDHYSLIVNGQERRYPSDDIAMIAFTPGDPAAAEVDRLPTVDNPPELERHTLVLKNGEMIRGKIYDFNGDQMTMDVRAGDRRTYNMSDIARLYISAPGARGVYKSVLVAQGNTVAPATPGGQSIRVEGSRQFTDTGITVQKGQTLTFTATGQVRINSDLNLGPAGDANLPRRRSLPLAMSAPTGSLIGRIGATGTRVFLIGANNGPITMPAAGRLFLGVNDDDFGDNAGGFDVVISH